MAVTVLRYLSRSSPPEDSWFAPIVIAEANVDWIVAIVSFPPPKDLGDLVFGKQNWKTKFCRDLTKVQRIPRGSKQLADVR